MRKGLSMAKLENSKLVEAIAKGGSLALAMVSLALFIYVFIKMPVLGVVKVTYALFNSLCIAFALMTAVFSYLIYNKK